MAEETEKTTITALEQMHAREGAIYKALDLAKIRGVTTLTADDIVKDAGVLLAFVTGDAIAPKAATTRKPRTSTPGTSTQSDTASGTAATTAEAPASSTEQKTSDPAAASATAVVEDDFLSETPKEEKVEEPKYELKDVRVALVDLQTKVSKDAAMKVLKEDGKVDILGNLKPENFAAVIKAAKKALPK